MPRPNKLALIAAAIVIVGTLVSVLSREELDGPVPIVWDKAVCANCRMQIGEPPFAAQLQTGQGQVLDFDDPGCLFELVLRERPAIRAAYFRHIEQDRWLSREEVGFLPGAQTPMGFGLSAVERDRPGALSFEQALERATARIRAAGAAP
jgi:hypothetical protein